MAEGVQYIHSEGIVHGDLCGVSRLPFSSVCKKKKKVLTRTQDNVLLDSDLHAQIADFGLTRHTDATATQSGALHYNFAAPELLEDWDVSDDSDSDDDPQLTTRTQKSDIYAFGCLYYEVCNVEVTLCKKK